MAKTKAKKGKGTLLKMGDGAQPEVFTTISEITSIKQQGAKFDELEATHMESPGDTKEFILGLKDNGSLPFEMNFLNDTSQKAFKAAEGSTKNFELHFPQLETPVKYSFSGICQAINLDIDPKNLLKASGEIRITGDIVEANLA